MNDNQFIKGFIDIKVTPICKDLGITPSNIVEGRASKEKTKQVKEEIEKRFHMLYLQKEEKKCQ